ncbi:carbohydrate-binding module family 21 protein [Hyaloscypha variabilis]
MPYTPPSQRSPAASAPHSPNLSRRSSYEPHQPSGPAHSHRPELPRSTSYLTRHRRTNSVKTASFQPSLEPTPPGTAEDEQYDRSSLAASSSLRKSPPPVTDDAQIPVGAIISPPDSATNSSDDEETKDERGRQLENLAELQAAIRVIEQHRESSPNRTAEEVTKANKALALIMPTEIETGDKPTAVHLEKSTVETLRKIGHNRSNTDTSVFIDLRHTPEASLSPSDEESISDEDEPERSRRKPQMLRKKSGELVRPALRPSSARRRPSSMPGTPTFSKAVHFDSHLEHVRHFLQVDRPLAVSAGSSPVEAYDSDNEFPFGEDNSRGPPFEWEIAVSNFPVEDPIRLSMPVRVERVFLSSDNKTLVGSVAVANLAFSKHVVARFTLDYWKTTSEVVAEYNHDIRQPKREGYDRFNFNIKLADQANLEAKTMFFCVKYSVNGQEYWDNNNSTNYQVDFKKKAKPQNGKKGMQGAASRPINALPRSNKKSPTERPKSMPVAFDDFAGGFDGKYKLEDFKQPVHDYLGESGSLRLKGVKSSISLGSDNLTRRLAPPHGQAFGNRYDFGASLSAAINAANTVLGDKSGLVMKAPPKKQSKKMIPDAEETSSPLAMSSNQSLNKTTPAPKNIQAVASSSGTESPRLAGTEKPVLASQSYNELLDKYCFVRTNEYHWRA